MVAKAKKVAYFAHLEECLKKYPRAFLVDADFVGSKQISDIRIALRGKAELLFGKNTMVRRCIRNLTEDGSHPEWEELLPYMVGNIGFVFTLGELSVVEDVIKEFVKPAAAKAGVIAFTKSVAKEVVGTGVICNCITPAVIQTEILEQVSQEHIDYMVSRIPLGRTGKAEEVGALIAWLASEDCSFSTGAAFDISGGRATY